MYITEHVRNPALSAVIIMDQSLRPVYTMLQKKSTETVGSEIPKHCTTQKCIQLFVQCVLFVSYNDK